ncbi:hypothetical protein JB92DRAFT_2743225 [Gautieria morchelliformis]|nr:hypothetical protein JB92DRAFT_2743225 [Gautieria morchelliformis]
MSLPRLVASLAQPCIPVRSQHVRVLQSPAQFHSTLVDMIARAKHRIFLSSLYIGTTELDLLRSLRHSLAANPRLTLHLSLDLLRSTRPGPASSASLLAPLVASFPDRVYVHLYKSPNLAGVLAKLVPRRFDEGWGTWHPKLYGVDDDLIISGANLNKSYFTNRQDRYLHFASSPALSTYCFDFLRIFSHLSYRLLPPETPHTPFTLRWSNPNVDPTSIQAAAQRTLAHFQSSQPRIPAPPAVDTFVVPIIQAGYLNVREEERCLTLLFAHLAHMPDAHAALIDLTSGYFALHQPYQDLLIHSPVSSRIIAAGPRANGFYGSKGMSGRIPEGYTLLEKRFWRKVLQANRAWSPGPAPGIELNEWEKNDWTYHAKGIWYRPTLTSPPELTLFGSTNLNSRSANLDTELSFFMHTSAPALRTQLDAEVHNLRTGAHRVDEDSWRKRERHVRFGTRMLVAAGVEGML